MKMYNANLSPFTSRCRIAIYAKSLDVELVEPPGGIVPGGSTSAEYRKINPIGKIPALDVDGQIIPESQVICEFLEDRFPTPALRPSDPIECARMRAVARAVDLYLTGPLRALFGQMNPSGRDAKVVEENVAALGAALDQLEALLGKGPFACADALSLADCAMVPLLFFGTRVLPAVGAPSPVDGRPRLAAWWDHVQTVDAPARVLAEMDDALRQAMAGGA